MAMDARVGAMGHGSSADFGRPPGDGAGIDHIGVGGLGKAPPPPGVGECFTIDWVSYWLTAVMKATV